MPTPISKLDIFFTKFASRISILRSLRATNITTEKNKFFKSQYTYNPQFHYPSAHKILPKLHAQLHSITPPDTPIGHLYQKKIIETQHKLNLLQAIGHDPHQFTQSSINIWGQPETEYLNYANNIISLPNPKITSTSKLTTDQIIQTIQSSLQQYNLPNAIEVINQEAGIKNISVAEISGIISVPENLSRSLDSINGMIAHEILTHIMRSQNGKQQPYGIFHHCTADYLATEEGLATLMSHTHKQNQLLKQPAKLLILIHTALHSDFITTFKKSLELGSSPENAWRQTLRVKRGLSDTSIPGAYTKDQYFQWAIQTALQLIKQPQLLPYAFNGKASLEELQTFTTPNIHTPPININQIKKLLTLNHLL